VRLTNTETKLVCSSWYFEACGIAKRAAISSVYPQIAAAANVNGRKLSISRLFNRSLAAALFVGA
jgi:hypothetical protein